MKIVMMYKNVCLLYLTPPGSQGFILKRFYALKCSILTLKERFVLCEKKEVCMRYRPCTCFF